MTIEELEAAEALRTKELGALLKKAEQRFQRASRQYEQELDARNTAIRQALAEGWTHSRIADATGLSRGRISQLA